MDPVAVVTGATGGIGVELVRRLAHRGFNVYAVGRDRGKLAVLVPLEQGIVWDAALEPEAVPDLLAGLERVDVLVHCAGVAPISRIADGDSSLVEVLAVNVIAASSLTRALLPALRTASGHVIFVNRSAKLSGVPGRSSYVASKAALREYADSLRVEEHDHGVRVTTVYPGAVATELLKEVRERFGRSFDPESCTSPSTAASLITSVLDHPVDGYVFELSFTR